MKRLMATTLGALAISAIAAPACAQPAPGPGAGTPQAQQPRPFSRPTERIEARLAYVRTALKITDAQEPQWKAYADKMRQLAAEREKAFDEWLARGRAAQGGGGQGQHPSSIERMEMRQKFHADAIRRLNEVLAVQRPLYAALSAEQKQVADVVLSRRGPGMRDGTRGPGSHRGHGRGGPMA
jgi:uncharacterized coiled-coil protein SlyX